MRANASTPEVSSESVSILIADDHEVVRHGLRKMLEKQAGWTICAEATNGAEAIKRAKELSPSVVILDMQMPDLDGLEVTKQIKRACPNTEVLIFTASEDEALIREVFAANARSYILKTDISEHLVQAITALSRHRSYFTSRVSEVVFAKFIQEGQPPTAKLTPREKEIVRLLAEGKSNKEVASDLGISIKTAETHRAAVMRKLEFDSFAELVRFAIREKMIKA